MAELNAKVTLKKKGEEAYLSVKQLVVSLKWTAAIDLDLMAFYQSKDGKQGAVFSSNYAGGNMGSLNSFPYIQLSEDSGVGAQAGENQEIIRISKLDDMAQVYICAVNFTDAVTNRPHSFAEYDAHVLLVDDRGESVAVPLDSTIPGTVAIIAKIDNTGFMGAKLINENQVLDLNTFQNQIPGANTLKLSSKIVLKQKGDSVQLKPKVGGSLGELLINLNWHQTKVTSQPQGGLLSKMFSTGNNEIGIDLDLGCLYELTTGEKGAIQALGNCFGDFNQAPYILHCGDDRTGSWSEGENLRINGEKIAQIKRILIYAFIYDGIANWSQADGVFTLKQPGNPEIIVNLDEHRNNISMCAIALLENVGNTFSVQKVVQYFSGHPEMDRAFNWGLRWTPGRK